MNFRIQQILISLVNKFAQKANMRMHILTFYAISDDKEIQCSIDVENRWRGTGVTWTIRKDMEVLNNHRRKSILHCLSLALICNDCRCHIVRHQHQDDNVVKTTSSATTLRHRLQNVVAINVPSTILRWFQGKIVTIDDNHIEQNSIRVMISMIHTMKYMSKTSRTITYLLKVLTPKNY